MTYAWNDEHDSIPVTKIEQNDDDEVWNPPSPSHLLGAVRDDDDEATQSEATSPPEESNGARYSVPYKKANTVLPPSATKDPPPPDASPTNAHKHRRIILSHEQQQQQRSQQPSSPRPPSRRAGAVQVVVSPCLPPSPSPTQQSPPNVKNRRCSFSSTSPVVEVSNLDVIPKRRRIEGPLLSSAHPSASASYDPRDVLRRLEHPSESRHDGGRGPMRPARYEGNLRFYTNRRTASRIYTYEERSSVYSSGHSSFAAESRSSQRRAPPHNERDSHSRELEETQTFSSHAPSSRRHHDDHGRRKSPDILTADPPPPSNSNSARRYSDAAKGSRRRFSPSGNEEPSTPIVHRAREPKDMVMSASGSRSRIELSNRQKDESHSTIVSAPVGRKDMTPRKSQQSAAGAASEFVLKSGTQQTPRVTDIETQFKMLENALLQKYRPRGMDALIFPEISGTTPISVNVTHVGKGVGKVMVMFEDLCLKILHYRMGWSFNDCIARIPEIRAVKRRPDCLPFFLQTMIDNETLEADKDTLLKSFISNVDSRVKVKSELIDSTFDQRRASRRRPFTRAESTAENSMGSETLIKQYPEHYITKYLDPAKVMDGHPQRYESFNKRFDFITRSLLWCLRPSYLDAAATVAPSRQPIGKSQSSARPPWERSVELNADVMNVWMALMQEWCDKLYEERLRRWEAATVRSSPSVILSPGQSSAVESSCHVLISSASTDVSCKETSNPPQAGHDLLSGYPLSSDDEDTPRAADSMREVLQVKEEELGLEENDKKVNGQDTPLRADGLPQQLTKAKKEEIDQNDSSRSPPTPKKETDEAHRDRPKRSLFLSTDFMTTFENFLAPSASSLNIKDLDPATLADTVMDGGTSSSPTSNSSSAHTKGNSGLEEGELSQETRQVLLRCGSSVSTPGGLSRAQAHKKKLLSALMQVTPVNSFTAACERVFRFFERRRWNPWDFDFICWPINYLTAHWVLLTVDIGRRELVWSDSYRKWYVEVVEKRADANKLQEQSTQSSAAADIPSTEVVVPTKKSGRVPYDLSLASSPSSSTRKTAEESSMSRSTKELFDCFFGKEPPSGASSRSSVTTAQPDASNSVRLRYAGWIHFLCVEEYLKYDFKRRKEKGGIDLTKYADMDKAFDEGVPWKRVVIEHLPQQAKLSLDCGVYSAHFARCVGQFACTDEIDFDTDDIDDFRGIMAVLIGRGAIPETPRDLAGDNEVF